MIPASRVKIFSTLSDGQEQITVAIFQGEHSLSKDNRFLGRYSVGPLRRKPAGEESVEIRFTYDLNGLLEVETTVLSTGTVKTLVLESTPGRLSPEAIQRAREKMQALKFHPRDSLPNATALARAEALYVELTGREREELGDRIANFRAALDSQEPELIAVYRDGLNGLVQALRR